MTPTMVKNALAVAFLFPLLVYAYISPGQPTGYVNDFAGILKTEEKQVLEAKITNFKSQTGNEIAVVAVANLGGDIIENFAVELFKEWGIGEKGKDNGVLLLIAKEDREVRIEVGYGLEGALTDAQSNWIIQNIIVPAFRENNFYLGINGAVDKIITAVSGEFVPSEAPEANKSSGGFDIDWLILIFFAPIWLASILGRSKSWWLGGVLGGIAGIIVGFIKGFIYVGLISTAILIPIGLLFDFIVSRAYGKAKFAGRRPPWWIGGSGFGGRGGSGFGGFGGGGSGGGGASGRW